MLIAKEIPSQEFQYDQDVKEERQQAEELATALGADVKKALEGRCSSINGKARMEGYATWTRGAKISSLRTGKCNTIQIRKLRSRKG